jgi:PAS domain S-box-containing protein
LSTPVPPSVTAPPALRVLVIDDDEVDRLSVRRILAASSIRVDLREAADAEAGAAAIRRGGLDCVLLDFRLPQSDGLTLLRRLRQEGLDVPVVMLTGLHDENVAVELMKAGAADYLSKTGLSPSRLEQSITHTVRMYRAERSASEVREALEASERQYRFMAESIPQIIWTTEADGSADYFNQRMYDYTGLSREDAAGWGWKTAIHPDDVARVTSIWMQAVATKAPYEAELRLCRASDRSHRWHLSRAVPLRDPQGGVVKWFGTCTDIEDQKRTAALLEQERARVEEANRAKDSFLATLSHELRTPLNAVLGWVRILLSRAVTEEKRERALRTIERNAQAQAQLIEDLLDVSRIASGKLRLEVGPVDFADIIEAALETIRPAADAKGVRLDATLDTVAGAVVGDAGRLQQVVSNLLTNAVKFTPRGGTVHVGLRRDGATTNLTVSDNGRGIAAALLPHVFERFRQSDVATDRSQGGLGLGLAIVRHLVELHGGSVEAFSDGEGKGARFAVTLPIAEGGPLSRGTLAGIRAGLSATAAGRLPELAGAHVLVVDDEQDSRELVRSILEDYGVRVSKAGTVADALAVFDQDPPDVLVSDIGILEESGYDLIRRVRLRAPDRGGLTPAVALTAYARAADRAQALSAGFNQHLAKPVSPIDLVVIVAAFMGRPPGTRP